MRHVFIFLPYARTYYMYASPPWFACKRVQCKLKLQRILKKFFTCKQTALFLFVRITLAGWSLTTYLYFRLRRQCESRAYAPPVLSNSWVPVCLRRILSLTSEGILRNAPELAAGITSLPSFFLFVAAVKLYVGWRMDKMARFICLDLVVGVCWRRKTTGISR